MAVTVLVLLAVGCGSRAVPAPPPSSVTVTATAAPTVTEVALAQGQPIPQIVQDVVLAVTANDAARVAALATYQQVACTTAQGAGGPPKCPPATAAGTSVRVFATGACEGEWTADAAGAIGRLMARPLQLYAVAQIRVPSPDPEPYWPKGRYAAAFSAATSSAGGPATVYFILDDASVLRAHAACDPAPGGEAALLRSLNAMSYLIPPR